jgi:uncharacterized membrane protein YphA (DoxX/SURF4 family)
MSLGELRVSEATPAIMTNGSHPTTSNGDRRAPTVGPEPWRADRLVLWLLRGGLAFVFLFAAMSSFLDRETFAGYFPSFLPSSWATELLPVFAVYEVVLAAALLSGRFTYPASVLAASTLVAITAANPDAFEVLFRNVAIACAALALAAQSRSAALAPAPPHAQLPADPGAHRRDDHQLQHTQEAPRQRREP